MFTHALGRFVLPRTVASLTAIALSALTAASMSAPSTARAATPAATTASVSQSATPPVVVKRVSARPQASRDKYGNLYEAASGFHGGWNDTPYQEGYDIWNTSDDRMYYHAREGMTGWSTPLPNGTYDVTLKMRDTHGATRATRVFDVAAEGATRLTQIDIAERVGYRTALDRTFQVEVRDGRLDVSFVPRRGVAIVSGIVITQVALVASAPRPVTAAPSAASGAGFSKLAFNDDFDSLATVDLTGQGDARKQWFTDRPFGWGRTPGSDLSVQDGVLTINQTTSSPNFAISTSSAAGRTGRGFKYGYFEARIAFDPSHAPKSPGFPAFWGVSHGQVLGADKPRSSEIDFFEAYSNRYTTFDDVYAGTVHDLIIKPTEVDRANWGSNVTRLPGFSWKQFHTYGCLWEPGKITWFLDGKPMHTQRYSAQSQPVPNPQNYGPGIFSELETDPTGQNVILGSGVGYPIKVDWVRVWQ